MIRLTLTDTTQQINCTARENGEYPYYLMAVDQRGSISGAVLSDVATNGRYDVFEVSDTDLGLKAPGQYNYSIYGQNSSSNTNPDSAAQLVESGVLLVTGEAEQTYTRETEKTVYVRE